MRDVNAVRDELVTMIEESVRAEMVHCPSVLGNADDVAEVLVDLLPSTGAFTAGDFDGDAKAAVVAWLEEASTDLDLEGWAASEACEGLFDGLIYHSDCTEFYAEFTEYCDEAVVDMGGFSELAEGCESVADIVSKAANYGADRLWREYVSDSLHGIRCGLERLTDEVGASV